MKVWVQFDIDEDKTPQNAIWANTSLVWDEPETRDEDETVNHDGLLDAFTEALTELVEESGSDMPGVTVQHGLHDEQIATKTGREKTWKDSKYRARRGY